MTFKEKLHASLLAALFISATSAQAGILTLLTAPGSDTAIPNFAALGSAGSTISSPAVGSGFTISNPGGSFQLLQQGASWSGDFAPGDALLWNGGNGPDTITFSSDLQSVGFKLQNDYFGIFTGFLDVYDRGNTWLGQVSEVGNSTSNGDNSAMFIGVSSDAANIYRIVISTSGSGGDTGANDFALGSGSFTAESPILTPEPSSFAFVASG